MTVCEIQKVEAIQQLRASYMWKVSGWRVCLARGGHSGNSSVTGLCPCLQGSFSYTLFSAADASPALLTPGRPLNVLLLGLKYVKKAKSL